MHTDTAWFNEPSGQLVFECGSASIFGALHGEWRISRIIENTGTFGGTAVFKSFDANTLKYSENGELRLVSGFVGTAFREYFYQLEKDRILVSFADLPPGARPFLTLQPPGRLSDYWAKDVHHCGSDNYECTYYFESRNCFRTHINVEGAAKKYTISTVFTRIGT